MSTATRIVLALATLAACGPAPTSPAPEPAEESAESAPSNRVDIPASVRKNLGITFAEVELRSVENTLRVPGSFELEPLARTEYRAALPGTVELRVDQLDVVEPGALLYRYRSPAWPELQHEVVLAEQEIATARAEIAVRRAALDEGRARHLALEERVAELASADFKKADLNLERDELRAALPRLEAELELALTRLANAERTREHALHRAAVASGFSERELEEVDEAGLPRYRTVDWIEVRATGPGVVEQLFVTTGAFVEPPAPVLSVVDPERLRFRAVALQADLPELAGDLSARIVPLKTSGGRSARTQASAAVDARLKIGLDAHPVERTVDLFAHPKQTPSWARPGVAAFLEVTLGAPGNQSLAVPRAAIVRDGLHSVLFRRDPANANQVIRIEADMGATDGEWVALQSGVMLGDQVVLSGAYELKLATETSGASQEGGHFHADGSFHDEH